ncbi:hypothetical protein [Candidatus Bathycorpusculum sp.]|uniref:hypothetical protein n=1 Tax=Candidatus Bathycorpusculum sp. TaxID=2994959 RepID=UPI002823C382|nr:hypothetical protein [Candidatus Termitimicrobium sp.]MCL2686882.1 hypothetical protein [Candidatus Termitimicrobium sp.]
MFRQQDNPVLSSLPEIQRNDKKRHRSLYAIFAVLGVFIVITAAVLLISQNESSQSDSSTRELRLNYAVGERMVYEHTNIATNQMPNTELPLPDTTNSVNSDSTLIIEVLSENSNSYTVKQTRAMTPGFGVAIPPITLSIDKASYYKNFVDPQGQFLFFNADSNPTLLAYLAKDKITIGDVWIIPVNTGNASLGLTGEVTLTFADTQEIPVPAGIFQTMRIEITSKDLLYHSDGTILSGIDGMNLQINGTSYVELGTFRAIKADLIQILTNAQGIVISTWYSEKTLVEYTKP